MIKEPRPLTRQERKEIEEDVAKGFYLGTRMVTRLLESEHYYREKVREWSTPTE